MHWDVGTARGIAACHGDGAMTRNKHAVTCDGCRRVMVRNLQELLDRLQGDVDDAYVYADDAGLHVTAHALHEAVTALETARAFNHADMLEVVK